MSVLVFFETPTPLGAGGFPRAYLAERRHDHDRRGCCCVAAIGHNNKKVSKKRLRLADVPSLIRLYSDFFSILP